MLGLSDLHDNQLEGLDHLQRHPRCALWMPMGGGKTVTTLTALDQLSFVEDIWPALIIGTLRVARSVWPAEPQEWEHLKHLKVVALEGTDQGRRRRMQIEAHAHTINFENIGWLVEAWGDNWPYRTIVADEASRLAGYRRRQGSKRAQALSKVAWDRTDRFIELTGTPASNGLVKLWGQMWFLDQGERLGRSYTAFEERWFKKGWDGYSVEPLDHAQSEIQGLIKDLCLTVTGLPVDLPIFNPVTVDLLPSIRKVYDAMEREMFAEIASGHEIEAVNAAARTNKLIQLCNGAVIYDDEGSWQEVHNAKLDALGSIIEEANGAPILVAYHYKSDLARLKKAFPKGRALDADPRTISDWNAGRIPLLFAHPACLHPLTEVLTEHRGWVRIIDVRRDERVFDGIEFVSHAGCSFSGVRPVIEAFGITLTPNHKLLIGQEWREAQDVRDSESARREARYAYTGASARLCEMLPVRSGEDDASPKRRESQQGAPRVVPGVSRGCVSPDDEYPVLVDMAPHEGACHRPEQPRLSSLWSRRQRGLRRLAEIRELLSRHVRHLRGSPDDRADRQLEGLREGQLPLGDEHGTAGQQEQQSGPHLPGQASASGRAMPPDGSGAGGSRAEAEPGDVRRGSPGGLRQVHLSEGQKITTAPVYDLVDCGPRNRFVIRNAEGEVFVSHNSAGHGLNLAKGGNILAFFSLDWNLENHLQIIERIGPMRQKQGGFNRPVFVHYIMARNTVDEMILERLSTKRSVQDVLLAAMRRRRLL